MPESIENTAANMMQLCEEMSEFARASMSANLKSVSAAAKGWDEGSQSAGHMIQENLSRMMSVGKTISEIKNPNDLMTMHQDMMKDCMDMWMASTAKLSEISARTMKDVMDPVAQHMNDALGRMMQKTRTSA